MNFSALEGFHEKWQDILVIGKTTERDNRKHHIVGMTLSEDAKLYIIEPYTEPENRHKAKSRSRTQRRIQKEDDENSCFYLHCSEVCLGMEKMQVQGATGNPLKYSTGDYGTVQLFFDMMSAGWQVPDWLENEEWDCLQLTTLTIADMKRLPVYSPEMPITITHRPTPIKHILEKTITLQVGKRRSFSFKDTHGDEIWCHINNVTLIDVWKDTEKQLSDPKLAERFSPEQLAQAREHSYKALEQNCPEGMCYVGIEYECSKDFILTFYSKEFLKSRPETHCGSSYFLLMRLRPDKETGSHHLPLKGCVIQTPLPPETTKIPAELFLYHEKVDAWTETVL
ncbi:MAG: hypothetical protein K2O16_18800 [Lachnospiraceae bacterium]|nr:hypothetical protein [Lachnospiraceae bacterium]